MYIYIYIDFSRYIHTSCLRYTYKPEFLLVYLKVSSSLDGHVVVIMVVMSCLLDAIFSILTNNLRVDEI